MPFVFGIIASIIINYIEESLPMKVASKVLVASGLSVVFFVISSLAIPVFLPFDAGSSEAIVLAMCFSLICFIIAERIIGHIEIVTPIDKILNRFEGLADEHIRLSQSTSFELFFERTKHASTAENIKALDGYWIALRRDIRKNRICAYIHKISRSNNEIRFSSFDENGPGEKYFVDGVVLSVANQAILYGKVRSRDSLHIYSLFVPAGEGPPYVFGTHFQTTLSGASSIATPVIFLRIRTEKISVRDESISLEHSDILESIRHIAKRHEDNELTQTLQDIDAVCDLQPSNINIEQIVSFLKSGKGSVEIDASMMDRHLG